MIPRLYDLAYHDAVALRAGGREITWQELHDAASAVAEQIAGAERVAVWAQQTPETVVAVVGALVAGVPIVPLNPKLGERELAHVLADSDPSVVLATPGQPSAPGRPRIDVDVTAVGPATLPPPADDAAAAFVVYTSGTTGPPKGAVLPRRAVASNLDALAQAWAWTEEDVVVHALPLFHVHGLIVGMIGALRRGGIGWLLGRFDPAEVADAFEHDATMLFAVPTMHKRLADAAEQDPRIAAALGRARLLVSGSAALPAREHERIERVTGQQVVERYGMTETLMNTAVRADGDRRPGAVGPALDGIELRLLSEADDDSGIGEILVRGPNLFLGYLNRPDATAEALRRRRLVPHRRHRHDRGRRLRAHRRPPGHRPDQERRLQDRRR